MRCHRTKKCGSQKRNESKGVQEESISRSLNNGMLTTRAYWAGVGPTIGSVDPEEGCGIRIRTVAGLVREEGNPESVGRMQI